MAEAHPTPATSELSVTRALVAAGIRSFSSSRRMNLLRTVGTGAINIAEAFGVLILLDRIGTIAGWTPSEVLLLLGIAYAGLGLGLIVGDPLEPPTFSQLLREGRFDDALTRPISPLLWVVTTGFQIRYLGRFAAGVLIASAALVTSGAALTPATVGLVVLGVVGMGVVVAAILVIGAAITMYTIEGTEVLNAFTYGGATLAGWPLQIYASALRATFVWAIPVGACVYLPTIWILGRDGPPGTGRGLLAAIPFLVGTFCVVAAMAWRSGVRRYTGAAT